MLSKAQWKHQDEYNRNMSAATTRKYYSTKKTKIAWVFILFYLQYKLSEMIVWDYTLTLMAMAMAWIQLTAVLQRQKRANN